MAQLVIYDMSYIQNLGKDEREKYCETKFESAAVSIFNNIDSSLKKNYSVNKVLDLITNCDSNIDGIITTAEACLAGDKDNILKLQGASEQETAILQDKINAEQELDGIKGIEKGLKAPGFAWRTIARGSIISNTTKENIINMLKNENVRNYYESEIRKDSDCVKHMKDLLIHLNITGDEIRQIGFSAEALAELL